MKTHLVLIAISVAALSGLSLVAGSEPDPCETYREMRAIYEESQGAYGWPRGAIRECENES